MSSCDYCGSICVSCFVGRAPAVGFRVTLTDSHGAITCRQKTDYKGNAVCPIDYADEYCVKVESNHRHSPLVQRRWFHLNPEDKCKCYFIFDKQYCWPKTEAPITGTIEITLRDANYPEYTLSGGVFTLWQTF